MVWGIVVLVWGVGCRVHSSGFGVCDLSLTVLGFRVYGSVFGVWALMLKSSEFKVYSLVFRVQGLGPLIRPPWDQSQDPPHLPRTTHKTPTLPH